MEADSYTKGAIILHWLIAVLLIGQIAGGLYAADLPEEQLALKAQLFQLHKSFGITILLLTVLRIGWRLAHKAPPLPAAMAGWEKLATRLVHIGFYVLLIAIPLLGWAHVSTTTRVVPTVLFGVIPWPDFPFLQRGEEVTEFFEEAHEISAKLMILLILVHVGAALKHHFVNRDEVLARMLPFLKKAS